MKSDLNKQQFGSDMQKWRKRLIFVVKCNTLTEILTSGVIRREGNVIKWLKRVVPALIIAAVVTGAAIAAFEYDQLKGAERQIINAKLRLRGQLPQTGNVVIAVIDNYSVHGDNLGRWPWPRSQMGLLIDTLNEYGAKVIGFDVFFPESDDNISLVGVRNVLRSEFEIMELDRPVLSKRKKKKFLKNLRKFYDKQLGAELERDPDAGEKGDELEKRLNPDNEFARSLTKHDNIILGYYFEESLTPEKYIDELDHEYKILEISFRDNGESVPNWLNNDRTELVKFLKNLDDQEKRFVPYETLRQQVGVFGKEFEENVENANEKAAAYGGDLEAVIGDFYTFCLDELLGAIYHVMGYQVDNPEDDIKKIIEKSYKGMEGSIINYESPEGSINPFLHAYLLAPNIEDFTKNCEHFGHVFVKPDLDGVIRYQYPGIYYGKLIFPSLSIKAASIFLKKTPQITLHGSEERPELKIGDIDIPLDREGRVLINYFGPKSYQQYSIFDIISGSIFVAPATESIPEYFQEVLKTTPEDYYKKEYGEEPREGDIEFMITDVKIDGMFLAKHITRWESEKDFEQRYGITPQEAFKDKIVLVGATATGIYDLRVTPFNENTPGVEIHAQVIDSILKGIFLQEPLWSRTYVLAVLAGLAIALALILPLMGAIPGAVLTIILLVGLLALDYFYFFLRMGYWLPVSYQALQLGSTFLFITIYRYATEEREKRFIKDTFGRYLAPSVVEHLTLNPELIQLGGEQTELTAFFSDIQGFSTISEKLGNPQLLVALLNDYLSVMANVIETYEGTIDKYEGDAIIAFWGAPVHFPDHALRACYACLDQQEKLVELREKWSKEGKWPEIVNEAKVRMGINTGQMVVGNMGSSGRMNYTIMGDAVNLAARLEGANKAYGTFSMISGDTYAQVKDKVEVRELDFLRVVGKTEPVRVYELLSRKGDLDPNKARILGAFMEGMEAYKRMEWQKAADLFQAVLNLDPDDMPSRAYLSRCKQYAIVSPPPDWDGVFSMTTK